MKTKYHLVVGTFYAFVTWFFLVRAGMGRFGYERGDMVYFWVGFALSLACLFLVNRVIGYGKFGLNKIKLVNCILLPIYSFLLFALPEEIIFRYFVQGRLLDLGMHAFWAILLASVVYGSAHILNGAEGMHPRAWNWRLVIMTTTLGVFLSALYYVTSSILLPVALHGIYIFIDQIFLFKKSVSARV